MLSFLFVILVSQISALNYNSLNEQNEYIKKLQEPDKKDFLERIVRRIAGEISLKDNPLEETKDISNAELEKHSDYVKKIIEEEKEKFENDNNKTIPLHNRKTINHSNIDFTLEEQTRNRRHETVNNDDANTETYITVPVKTVYDTVEDLNPVESLSKDDIQVKGLRPKSRRSTASKSFDSNNVDNVVSSSKNKDISNENAGVFVLTDKVDDESNVKKEKVEDTLRVNTPELVSSNKEYTNKKEVQEKDNYQEIIDDSAGKVKEILKVNESEVILYDKVNESNVKENKVNNSSVTEDKMVSVSKLEEDSNIKASEVVSSDKVEKNSNVNVGDVVSFDKVKYDSNLTEKKVNSQETLDKPESASKVEEESLIKAHDGVSSEKVKDESKVKQEEIVFTGEVEKPSHVQDENHVKLHKVVSFDDSKAKNEDTSSVTESSDIKNVTMNSDLDNYTIGTLTTTTIPDTIDEKITYGTIKTTTTSGTDDTLKVLNVTETKEKQLDPYSISEIAVKVNHSEPSESEKSLSDVLEKIPTNTESKETVTTFSTVKIISQARESTLKITKPLLADKKKPRRTTSKLSAKTNVSSVKIKILRSHSKNYDEAVKSSNKNENELNTIITTTKIPAVISASNSDDNVSKTQYFIDSKNKMTQDVLKNISKYSNEKINNTNIDSDAKGKIPEEVKDDIKTLQIAQYVVRELRTGINKDILKKKPNIKNNFDVYGAYDYNKENVHKTHDRNAEQPFYVPVYSYSENNAYYNAYNKYGPNHGDPKGKIQKTTPYSDESPELDLGDIYSSKENRAFYKTPLKEHSKHASDVIKAKVKNAVFPILPSVNNNTPKLPFFDYDYFDGKLENEENALRSLNQVQYSELYLKDRIKNIRQSMYNFKRVSKVDNDKKVFKDTYNKGWLNPDVEYYTKHNIAKKSQALENIDYDYLGENYWDRNNKLFHILKSTKDKKKGSQYRNVTGKNKKGKSDNKLKFDIKEVYPLLKKLVKIVEFDEDDEVEACVRVMGDLIKTNNEGLTQYDWLESTVNIQSAIEKLTDLTSAVLSGDKIHPSDLELLKFTTRLHSFSDVDKNGFSAERSAFPKVKKNKKVQKDKNLKNRIWLYRMSNPGNKFDYKGLQRFLDALADNLYDLHNAIKHISMVTTLRSQNWFRNLKDLYLRNPSRKQLLELILHLGSTRLFNLIEDSSKNGLEKNFLKYVRENEMELSRITDAFKFLLKVLDAAVDNRLIENY